jgi:hemolysin activation/secretion protein
VSSEQISYGGSVFGQAYTPNVISGDSGAMGSIALRYDMATPGWMSMLQPQIFYDVGTVAINDPSPGTASDATGQSAGFGLNMELWNHLQMGFTVAKPLSVTNTTGVAMGWQGFFNITGAF